MNNLPLPLDVTPEYGWPPELIGDTNVGPDGTRHLTLYQDEEISSVAFLGHREPCDVLTTAGHVAIEHGVGVPDAWQVQHVHGWVRHNVCPTHTEQNPRCIGCIEVRHDPWRLVFDEQGGVHGDVPLTVVDLNH